MKKISAQIEKRVIEMLLKGDTYEKIARATGTCKALVNRVYNDQKKRTPDFDQLRKHAKQLRKYDLTVFDEKRIHELMKRLNNLDVSFEQLEDYLNLTDQFLCEQNHESDIIHYALGIKQLEAKYNKSPKELLEDFEKIQEQIQKLNQEKSIATSELKKINQGIKTDGIELKLILQRIRESILTEDGLKKIGIKQTAQVAKMIRQCEAIDFDPQKINQLLSWREKLQKLEINPDKFGEEIKEHGTLKNQNQRLKFENQKIKNDNKQQKAINTELISKNPSLEALDQILESQSFSISCKICPAPIPIKLTTKQQYIELIQNNLNVQYHCTNCNTKNLYSGWEILSQFALSILPEYEIIQI